MHQHLKRALCRVLQMIKRSNEPTSEGTHWTLIGASAQGTSHLQDNIPCQDAHIAAQLKNGMAIIAYADGAGSARRSHEGSQSAVKELLKSLQNQLEDQPIPGDIDWHMTVLEAYKDACRGIEKLAAEAREHPREFATTLGCGVLWDRGLVTGNLGDGMIVAQKPGEPLFIASAPQRGEYANQTWFLTSFNDLQHLQVHYYPESVAAIVAMSDGIWNLAVKRHGKASYTPSMGFFEPLLEFAAKCDDRKESEQKLVGFLSSERVSARSADDKTLVLALHSSSYAKCRTRERSSAPGKAKRSRTRSQNEQSSTSDTVGPTITSHPQQIPWIQRLRQFLCRWRPK